MTRLEFVMRAAVEQEPLLFLAPGGLWEGYVDSVSEDRVVAIVRQVTGGAPVGQSHPYSEQHWYMNEIVDMDRRSPEVDGESESGVFAHARLMLEQARAIDELSLAERLLRNRTPRKEHHGRD